MILKLYQHLLVNLLKTSLSFGSSQYFIMKLMLIASRARTHLCTIMIRDATLGPLSRHIKHDRCATNERVDHIMVISKTHELSYQ